MNKLLLGQSKSANEIVLAEQDLIRAQQRLENAKRNKDVMDAQVNEIAEKLTDSLLKENTRWNSMYEKMMEYKAKYGHCDIKRNPMRTSKSRKEITAGLEDLGILSALGSWTGKNN